MLYKFNTLFTISFLSVTLVGCGGGSSESNTDNDVTPPGVTNQAPQLTTAITDQTTNQSQQYSFDLSQGGQTFSDPDGDELTYSFSTSPQTNDFTLNGTVLSGTPEQTEAITITVTASDPSGLTASDSYLLTINGAPQTVKSIPDQSINLGENVSLDISQNRTTFIDPDGDELTYTFSTSPQTSDFTLNGSVLSGTPALAQTVTFTVTATDPNGLSANDSFLLNINGAPKLTNSISNQSVNIGENYNFDVTQNGTTFEDLDSEILIYSVQITPTNNDLTFNGTHLSGVPNQAGEYTIAVTATDDGGLFDSTSFVLYVVEPNENNSPIVANPIADQSATLNQDFNFDMSQNNTTFSDPDGDMLTFQVAITPTDSGLTSDGLILSGSPNQTGEINVTVTASDPAGLSVSDTFSVDVSAQVNTSKPNVLLIIADDLGQDSSNQYTFSTDLPTTPTIDEIAAQGIVFENLWVNPVCSPTRSTIFTGKYGTRTQVLAPGDELSLSETSLPQALKNHPDTAEYASAKIGKWHLGGDSSHPAAFGLDYYAGIFNGAVSDYYNWELTTNGQTQPQTEYATTVLTDLAIDWLNQQTTPWFLWMGYNAPHTPFHLPPNELHSRNLSGDEADIEANPRAYYLAAVEALDSEINRLLNSLDQATRDNTVVIFIGDNGTPTQARFRGSDLSGSKNNISEGGIRVPMIVSGKNVTRQGQREANLLNGTDFFSTILAIAGQEEVAIHDSLPFNNLLNDASATPLRETAFSQNEEAFTIRNARYKLIEYLDGTRAFYDLQNDISEQTDLISGGASLPTDFFYLDSQLSALSNDGWIVNKHNEQSSYMMDSSAFVEVNVLSVQDNGTSTTVTTNATPNYKVIVTDEVLTVYHSKPEAAYANGQVLSLNQQIDYGQDIGLTANCGNTGGDGWWPQAGAACPESQSDMALTFPNNPTPTQTECETGLGPVGLWVNGVPIYNWSDASSYNNQDVWNNFALPFRSAAMDVCNGHSGNGMYHHHSYNACLKQQLGDEGKGHSPIYGYAGDGYPIHGPYHSKDVLAKSCWKKRDYSANSATGCGSEGQRTCKFIDEENISLGVENVTAGPATSDIINFFTAGDGPAVSGIYYEDYYYDPQCTAQGEEYLDEHSGHDHDGLGYHYHTSVDENLSPVFPLVNGPDYYGSLNSSSFQCFRREF